MKTLVLYYSQKGSNRYLAERIAKDLSCDLEAIRPRLDAPLLMMAGLHLGNRKLQHDPAQYDRVILCGPIWMGRFIAPLRAFVKRHLADIQQLVFVTCCGSTDEKKDEKFGYGLVFKQVKAIAQGKCSQCQAFPIGLVLPPEKREDSQRMMTTHLNDDNFKGEMAERYAVFMQALGR